MSNNLQRHPDYQEHYDDWDLCQKLFSGQHKVVCKDPNILWPHAIEETVASLFPVDGQSSSGKMFQLMSTLGAQHWARRSRRTRWLNLPEIIGSMLVSFMLREKPNLSEVEELFGDDINNVDGEGNSLYSFIKNKFTLDYLKFGKAIIKVESTQHDAANLLEEMQVGARPYFRSISPLALPDWERTDGTGITNFNWLRYEYARVGSRDEPTQEPDLETYSRFYKLTGEQVEVRLYKKKKEEGGSTQDGEWDQQGAAGVLELDRVPFVVLEDVSWLKDVNQECLRFHNLRSGRDNILHNQCYQKVILFGVDASNPDQLQALGETTWPIIENPNGKAQVIEPPSLDDHNKAIEESVNNIFKVGLNVVRTLPSDSRLNQAAEAIAEEKENPFALVESTLEDIENAVNEAVQIWAQYKSQKNFKGKVVLNKEISKQDYTRFITVWSAMKDQFMRYPGIVKSATKKGVEEMAFDEEDEQNALDEVEAGPTLPDPTLAAKAGTGVGPGQPLDPIAKILKPQLSA